MRLHHTLRAVCAAALLIGPSGAMATDFAAMSAKLNELTHNSQYVEALELAEEFSNKAGAEFGLQSTEYAATLMRKGAILQLSGQTVPAGPTFEKALEIYQKNLPPDHPDIAAALNNLGMQRHWLGEYKDAIDFHKKALAIREMQNPTDPLQVAESLNNLAHTYQYLERMRDARPLLERGLALRQGALAKPDTGVAQLQQNLASVKESFGEFEEAQNLLKQALSTYAKRLPKNHALPISVLNRLALNLYLQQRFTDAEPLFQEALSRQRTSQQWLLRAAILTDSAINKMALGKLKDAEKLLDEALGLRTRLLRNGHIDVARTLGDLAEVAFRQGDLSLALKRINEAVEIAARVPTVDDRVRLIFFRYLKYAWEAFEQRKLEAPEKLLRRAFLQAQRASQTQTATTVARMGTRFASRNEKLRDLLKRVEDLETEQWQLEAILTRSLALPVKKRKSADRKARGRLNEIQKENTKLHQQITQHAPDYVRLVRPEPVSIESVQGALLEDEAAITIIVGRDETHVFVVSKTSAAWQRVARSQDEISRWVTTLRDGITAIGRLEKEPNAALFDLGLAHNVYAELLRPVEHAFADKQNLMFVANGPLTSLPPQILLKSAPAIPKPTVETIAAYGKADWLVRHHALSVLPAVNNLTILRQANVRADDKRKPLIGFANPVFGPKEVAELPKQNGRQNVVRSASIDDGPDAAEFSSVWLGTRPDSSLLRRKLPPLPDTETELKNVAKSLGATGEHLLFREAASEKAVKKSRLRDFRVVYFATHGLVAGEIKGLGEPALALSIPPTPSPEDDGLLTVSEAAFLDLDSDWVVLSACNTAAPGQPGAEGLSGLARAFFHAGTRAMLVSHWPVYSDDTSKLMQRLFEEQKVQADISRAQALRQAMLARMKEPGLLSGYPTFWAPFVLVGEASAQ